jgi:hypothetical protein
MVTACGFANEAGSEPVSRRALPGTADVVETRDTRREANQRLFRLGNERLQEAVDDMVDETQRVPFLCECADEFCNGRVELRLDEWEDVLKRPRQYVTVPGHPQSDGEMVVGSIAGYDVVGKPG